LEKVERIGFILCWFTGSLYEPGLGKRLGKNGSRRQVTGICSSGSSFEKQIMSFLADDPVVGFK